MSNLTDRDLARVLDRAGTTGHVDPARRSEIRASVLREFDRSAAAVDEAGTQSFVLTSTTTPTPTANRGSWTLLAAAAIVAIVVGGLLFVGSRGPADNSVADQPTTPMTSIAAPAATPAPTSASLGSVDELLVGAPIPAGRYDTAVAGGLTFEVPTGAWLISAETDRLTLGHVDDEATISVVPIENAASLNAAIDQAEADGLLRVERSAGRVGDRAIVRRDLTITAKAVERYNCVAGEQCDGLDADLTPLALQSGAENFATLLELDADTNIVIVEQFATFGPPRTEIVNSIIETIERSD